MYNLLLICANSATLSTIGELLRQRGYYLQTSTSPYESLKYHREEGADLVVVFLPLKEGSSKELLSKLKAQDPRAIIVVCGKDDEVKGAPEAIKYGAFEYLSTPIKDVNALLSVIGIGVGARISDAQLRYLRKKDAESADWRTIVGRSKQMLQVFSVVRQICYRTTRSSAPTILVSGETGTGKGLLAKAIHYNSVRRSNAFVEINCAALPPSLIEAELFGHIKGAFTDARSSRAGLFETAAGGTLFLDEVSAIPLELQTKLLTTIEEKKIRRLGSSNEILVDVQIIAATNRDLVELVELRKFRDDLYHRLSVLTIELPPLDERGKDKILLAEEFIQMKCREYGLPIKQLDESAVRTIMDYDWPGNVRELRNHIERIVMLEDGPFIKASHFQLRSKLARVEVNNCQEDLQVRLPEDGCSLDGLEREVIRQALSKHNGNVAKTARFLRMTRRTLIYRIKKHQIA